MGLLYISSNMQVLNHAARLYQQALNSSGYTDRLNYECELNNNKIDKRKIDYLTTAFSFDHKLHKLYCCVFNI